VAALRQALQLEPTYAPAMNDLAWILATNQDPAVRDGAEAVRLAEQACQLAGTREPRYWGTLDAAYAEQGKFDDAIAAAEKAQKLAREAGQGEIVAAAEHRLALYRKQEP